MGGDARLTVTTYSQYDAAGNSIRSGTYFRRGQGGSDRYYTATRNYYAADNRLVAVQRYNFLDASRDGAWEEFRYDALGRRVLTRSRRDMPDPWVGLCSGGTSVCKGYVERTVWDGDQVLYELRTDGSNDRTAAQLDQLVGVGILWGKAGYVHAGGIDKPLVTMDGRVPSYNWRGLPESSTWTDGGRADCSLGSFSGCVTIAWPSANSIYLRPPPPGSGSSGPRPQWVGSVLQDGAGSTGMLYRRNRYYDPGTGQFTQQDPIGIAGGANVYGFASGDPVNFSDPFGLCPPRDENRADCTVILNGARLSNPNFVKTLTTFAQYVGRDIVLNGECSGDRTAECQQKYGGVASSAHTSNEGADIHAEGYSNLDLAQLASESGLFTGVGYYEGSAKTKHGPHAHVDTKNRRAKWWEDKEGTTRPGLPPKPEDQ